MTLKRKNKLILTMVSLVMVLTLLGLVPPLAAADEPTATGELEQAFYLTVRTPDNDTIFLLPTSSYLRGTYGGKPYDWMVDWGDGVVESRFGTSSQSGGIPHTYALAGDYTIIITPNGSTEAWLGAFSFYWTDGGSNSTANKRLVIGAPSLITPQMTRTTAQIEGSESAPDYEWSWAFYFCTSLVEAPSFAGWENVTSVGDGFAYEMFSHCDRLNAFPLGFQLPQGLVEAGDTFAAYLFYWCTSLATLPNGFTLPQGLVMVGDYFAAGMLSACFYLAELPATFNLPQALTKAGDSFAYHMFHYDSRLNGLPNGFNLPQGITEVGSSFVAYMFWEAGSATFQLNDEFCFPAGIPADSIDAFFATFDFANSVPIQNRTAISIIGDCPTPSTPSYTFGSHFIDFDDIPENWSGTFRLLVEGSGDLNGDGVVSMDEVVITLQATIGTVELSSGRLAVIDMDFDGMITMADVVLALQKTV
ncbi:MAG: hypothetical protein FWH40_04355 [Coriobacteriia bacterium]|nr:hypothetical protein [Coriobacteriia bacterium]